ncbi:flagellar hook protein FlgE [Sulfurirhabdus autotrophica]|uniref:Flagellar hook protein FlgE n=1 Tax=Sulfurirhabdus autotrophica TaxID=1706046 RepID=A0A4V2W363_9PROT|nr:flagellar hook protein FlgE [Sulfurirhabdus autotrophica]TCV90729.1 flagellar hook protein FlgE [Sulfurirhabdus autotrophica]
MGFQQGLSGLNAASKNLDTIGNNVSNSGTVGFKASQAQFADVYANSLTGAGGLQIGIGTQVSSVVQQFTQGNVTTSNNPLDLAINGKGFYRISDNGTIAYARNGQFQLDKDGFIVTSSGKNLTGYAANAAGVITPGSITNMQVTTANLPPSVTTTANIGVNLDSRASVVTATPFDPTVTTSYTTSTAMTVYDALGNAQTLGVYFAKTAANTWDVYGTVTNPAGDVTILNATPATTPTGTPTAVTSLGTLTFSASTGALASSTVTLPAITSTMLGTGATAIASFLPSFTGSTQYGSSFGVSALTQNGYASGRTTGFGIDADGILQARYSNGQSLNLGQVVLADFKNPQGLQPLGNNLWAETAASGQPIPGAPGTSSLGVLQSSAVEDSNVDLTQELVNMITAQRSYQANAQTIKTQDQVLQTLVNLR